MVIALGGAAAGLSYLANIGLLGATGMDFDTYARTLGAAGRGGAARALVILALVRTHRIGFLVDAAIFGFAVGAGFAMVENLYYLQALSDASLGGLDRARLRHRLAARRRAVDLRGDAARPGRPARPHGPGRGLPALLAAAVLHAGFNQFVLPPIFQTLALMLLLPPLMMFVFARSEARGRRLAGRRLRRRQRPAVPARLRRLLRVARTASTCIPCARASPARWSPTCCATCACTSSWRCAPRAC